MGGTKVFKYEDIILRDFDLDTLEESCYLNDQIIAFYFTYLSSNLDNKTDTLLVLPYISHWIANSEDDKYKEDYVQSCEISSKRVVVFAVNDDEGHGGSHWSTLVYDRTKNMFLHFDSLGFCMEGVNSLSALKLYDALKEHMGPGGEVARPQTSSLLKKEQRNKKGVASASGGEKATAPAGLPVFMECETPQQTNGYDCGLYVLAIAREICQWCSREHNNKSDIVSTIKENVDDSVEMKMRKEVRKIIEELTTTDV